jgi:hypothetical protein
LVNDLRAGDAITLLLAMGSRSGIATNVLYGSFVSYSKRHAGFIDRDYAMG